MGKLQRRGIATRKQLRTTGHLRATKAILKHKKLKPSQLRSLKKKLEALQKQVVIKLYGTDCYTHQPKATQTTTKQLGHMPWARAELSQTCIYDYRFTRIQCGQCNGFGQGMSMTARQRMTTEGIDLDALWELNLATKGKPHSSEFYLNKIKEYESLLLGE